MTTPLYILRCLQIGLRIEELNSLEMGMVMDILAESSNDEYEYPQKATQKDFDMF